MEMTQVKGVAITVGATAAFTALLTGSIVSVHNYQDKAASVDTVEAFNGLQLKATSLMETGLTDVFSDHCLTLQEGADATMDVASWVPEKDNPKYDPAYGDMDPRKIIDLSKLDDRYDWQWVNTQRDTESIISHNGTYLNGSRAYIPTYVAKPSERSQDNLNQWFHETMDINIGYLRPGFIKIGAKEANTEAVTPVIAAHCRWIINVRSNAIKYATDAPQLKDDVTLSSDPTCGDDEWLIVNGQKAHVTAHGRAYYTREKPLKANDVPADATLIGETDLDFSAPGTQTATVDKPASLNDGYVTWVWSIEKNNQPTEWGKYLLQDTTDGWSADDEVVELPKAPEPAPSVSAPTVDPSVAPTPSTVTPSPEPSVTTPAPSESQTLPPTTAPSTTPSAGSVKTPVTHMSLTHTGSSTLPLFGLSATALAGGLTLALRKRNVG